eukprot:5161381-Amphidinium_carterae.1
MGGSYERFSAESYVGARPILAGMARTDRSDHHVGKVQVASQHSFLHPVLCSSTRKAASGMKMASNVTTKAHK